MRAKGSNPLSPELQHLSFIPLLYRNIVPAVERKVEGAGRCRHIERDAVLPRHNRFFIGTDLIGKIPVPRYPVGPHDDHVHLPRSHVMPRRIVHYDRVRNSLLQEFPCGQPCALKPRPRFVHEDEYPLSIVPCRAYGSEGGAVIAGCESARIAMC